jgi:hypothetical protein
MKNFMITLTLESYGATEHYFAAMETESEADIRGAMKNEKASFQMQWNAGKETKLCSAGGRWKTLRTYTKHWARWARCLTMTSKKCPTY